MRENRTKQCGKVRRNWTVALLFVLIAYPYARSQNSPDAALPSQSRRQLRSPPLLGWRAGSAMTWPQVA